MVQFVAIVGVLGHEKPAIGLLPCNIKFEIRVGMSKSRIIHLVIGCTRRVIFCFWIVLGTETVHQLMDQVENTHSQWNSIFLSTPQTDPKIHLRIKMN